MSPITALLAGRYRLDDQIAAGGVGEVWLAEDVVLDRPVAVKLLRAEYAQHAETRARFRFEAKHAASLTHPAIAQVFDYQEGDAHTRPFLVMELVDGPSLADVLSAGPLEPVRVMDIVAQAAAGLDAAHEAGLVHRDIKPGNLLLTPDGKVKITDFGIAYAAGTAPVTRHGQVIGTPAYLAPERIAGQAAGPASDLYALGILAHECLTGVRPFAGTPIEIVVAHGQQALPPLPASVPPAVAAFVGELAAKDPADRPASARLAAARAAELRDWLASGRAWPAPGQHYATQMLTDDAHPATLAVARPPWYADPDGDGSWPSGGAGADRGWPRRRVLLAIGVASVLAGLIGWLISSATTASTPPAPAASSPAASNSSSPAAGTVTVDANALIGQPYKTVRDSLRGLGLVPQIVWVPQDGQSQSPGTVISVQPSGPVQPGSVITVTVIQSHDHGNGGDGNGNGSGG